MPRNSATPAIGPLAIVDALQQIATQIGRIDMPASCNAEIETLITMINEVGNLLFGAAQGIEDAIRDVARAVKLLSIREVPK